MSKTELHELDDFCAERVMEWHLEDGMWFDSELKYKVSKNGFAPTTTKGYAMDVLEKCVKKLGGLDTLKIGTSKGGGYEVSSIDFESTTSETINSHAVIAETLQLSICLFAQKLFS